MLLCRTDVSSHPSYEDIALDQSDFFFAPPLATSGSVPPAPLLRAWPAPLLLGGRGGLVVRGGFAFDPARPVSGLGEVVEGYGLGLLLTAFWGTLGC